MSARWWMIVVLAAATAGAGAVGCGSKSGDGGGGGGVATPAAPSTDALWKLAPPSAKFGLVMADGTASTLLSAVDELTRISGAQPPLAEALAKARAEVVEEWKFDPNDRAALAAHGLDPARGAAFFMDPDEESPLAVLPVSDPAKFRDAFGFKAEKAGDRELVRIDETAVCAEAGGHFLCGKSVAAIDAAAAAHESPLAARVLALPAELRGHVELVADLAAFDDAQRELAELAPAIHDIGLLAVGVRVGGGAVTVRGWVEGKLGEPIGTAIAANQGDPKLRGMGGGAAMVMRVAIPMAAVLTASGAPESAPGPDGLDFRKDLADQLTGDFGLYAIGKGASMLLVAGLKEEGGPRKAIKVLCQALGEKLGDEMPGLSVQADGDSCVGTYDVSKAGLPDEALPMLKLLPTRAVLSVRDRRIELAVGEPGELTGGAADVAGSAGARDLLGGAWQAVAWWRGLDPMAAMPAETVATMSATVGEEAATQIHAFRWVAGHVYEVGMAGALRADGFHGLMQITTFAGDPPAAYAAYEAALAKSIAGDGAGYQAAMAAIEKDFPGTLAAKQAHMATHPAPAMTAMVGVLAAVAIPAFLKYERKSKVTEAVVMLRKMSDGAQMYAAEGNHPSGFGAFPPSVGPTPPPGACCQQGGTCTPKPDEWADPTWQALHFSMDDTYQYSYQFISEGSVFTARAVGDLDCDGVYSTFEMHGLVGADGAVQANPEIYRDNELE